MSAATLQRAFELADGGGVTNMTDLRKAMHRERLDQVDAHLSGGSIQKQLMARMTAARANRSGKSG